METKPLAAEAALAETAGRKPRISQIVIVEGRDDQSAVLAAVDCQLIVTHGFGIRAETWKRIQRAAEGPGIIVFTDPDHAGEEIRRRITEKFPDVPTFVVTPIWRSNYQTERSGYQSFFDIEQGIRRAVADKKNIILIPGFDMIPHDEVYYADQVLHPNDSGFDHYFDNLKKYLKKYI